MAEVGLGGFEPYDFELFRALGQVQVQQVGSPPVKRLRTGCSMGDMGEGALLDGRS